MLTRGGFIRIAGGGIVLAVGGIGLARCDRMPPEAIEGWRQPGRGEKDVRKRILSYAILAPNPHNRQPWLVDLKTPGRIVLYCDRTRLLPHTDPYARQIVIGHGTFLELLDMAAGAQGYRAAIVYFPKGAFGARGVDDRPVAEITLTEDPSRKTDPLFKQALRRHTNRETYDSDRPLTAGHLSALRGLKIDPAVRLTVTAGAGRLAKLRRLASDALILEIRTPAKFAETIEVMRLGAAEIAEHRDGLSLNGPMMWWLRQFGMLSRGTLRDPASKSFGIGLDMAREQGGSAMAFAWLTTQDNERATQLKAGRAYLRLHLKTTELGLAQHPMSQLLQEYSEMAELKARFLEAVGAGAGQTVQMLARLGHAPRVGPAPRRRLGDMIRA